MTSAYDASTTPHTKSLGWPTISNLVEKETAILMYNSLNELAFEYMLNIFTRCSESNGRILRSANINLKLPLSKKEHWSKSFSYRAASLLNSMSWEIKGAGSRNVNKLLSKR